MNKKKIITGTIAILLVILGIFLVVRMEQLKLVEASAQLENYPDVKTSLSETEMLDSVKSYVDLLSTELSPDGIKVVLNAKEDGSLSFDSKRPELDVDGNKTGKMMDDVALYEFDSLKDAFNFLHNNGQLDKDGKLLVSIQENTSSSYVSE